MILGEYTGFVEFCEHFLSGSEVHHCSVGQVCLGARAGAGAGTPGRVTWRPSAATGGVAARTTLAPAPAPTATTRARSPVAGAARTVHLHTDVCCLSLMRAKLGVVQFTDSVGHVFFAYKLHHSGAITVHISITYITCLSHVILQVLPAPTGRKT